MIDFIRAHQLNIMLLLCGCCGIMVFLLAITRFLSRSRKIILMCMETVSFFLLWFDRMAYIYAGDVSRTGYLMVRLSNFLVFFLTSGTVFVFNFYLTDWLVTEGKMEKIPARMKIVTYISALGMLMAVISNFTGLYYYFDETNTYHRGSGFYIAYIFPIVGPIIQFTVIQQFRKIYSKVIYISLLLYIFVPIICGLAQIILYGISIVNMAMVAVSVSLYIFTYIDINDTVQRAHEIEIQNMKGEQVRMQKLFDQTAMAFVMAVEKKDDYSKGKAVRVAEYARKIAEMAGKDEDLCQKAYYAGLLHDVGLIGIPDSVIMSDTDPDKRNTEVMRKKPVIGREILSNITEFPFLGISAGSSHERYDGTGYPEGLEGEQIPEIARIVGVADSYVTMTSKKRYRDAKPDFMVREAFVKDGGLAYDPKFANIMVKIIDEEGRKKKEVESRVIEKAIFCKEYRDQITNGIVIDKKVKRITFKVRSNLTGTEGFSSPSAILFDSFDGRVHRDQKNVDAYQYLEFAEFWFDENFITTGARKIVVDSSERHYDVPMEIRSDTDTLFEIVIGRYEDHLRVTLKTAALERTLIVALPDRTKTTYLSLTGENCDITEIAVSDAGSELTFGDIPRIADEISYINHIESDIENLQIDRTRSATTKGVEIGRRLKLCFHTMSLPGANLVWHCPYVVLFYSDDGKVNGPNYKEYALLKINGENEGSDEFSENRFVMKRTSEFPGWDDWKEINKRGLECEINIEKRGNQILTRTENLGIIIDNTTTITGDAGKVYAALTGDQVALTDIRIR